MALLGTIGSQESLSQTLATTANRVYLLSFWYNTVDGTMPNQMQVSWNGSVVTNIVNQDIFPGDGWANFQFVVTATGSSTPLQFLYEQDASYLALDDVSVQPVPPPVFQSAVLSAGSLNFTWNSVPGVGYQVQYKTNLLQSTWLNLGAVTHASGPTLSASDPVGPDPKRFYRILVSP
jgi:hypothetical protein